MNPFVRNVPLLATNQALLVTGNSLIVATAALVGAVLAPHKTLATLPMAVQHLSSMLTSIPASLLMDRIGRKAGFMLSTVFGAAGASLAMTAIIQKHFWMFLSATPLIGIYVGFGTYYRFAAADAVESASKGRAISWVMVGGLAAAFVGPNLARLTETLISEAPFAGSYGSLIFVYALGFMCSASLNLPKQICRRKSENSNARPLKQIARQPKFIVALICGMFGYGVMTLVMTATPLAMHQHAHSFGDTSIVIQWHIVGMFAPSFFTGNLIRRFGLRRIMILGSIFELITVFLNLAGNSFMHFLLALVFLGMGWNFLFIGATTLLTETYRPEERARTQAANDFTVFTTVAISSLSAGALQHRYGWQTVNWGVVPMLVLILASLLWLQLKTEKLNFEM